MVASYSYSYCLNLLRTTVGSESDNNMPTLVYGHVMTVNSAFWDLKYPDWHFSVPSTL